MTLVRMFARPMVATLLVGALGASALTASAQFDPPSTVYGSITDAEGEVPEGLPVEAYIGDVLCGTRGSTEFTGDGDAKVTVYAVNVVAASQIAGCGTSGADVRIKIGDRFAEGTADWEPGPVQFDVTFGGASPAPIPTFTPAPTRTPEPPATNTQAPGGNETPGQGGNDNGGNGGSGEVETIPPGSPGAGSPVSRPGGVTSSDPNAQEALDSDDGGFPVWGVVVLLLGGIAAVGGGVGLVMARNRNAAEADAFDDDPYDSYSADPDPDPGPPDER